MKFVTFTKNSKELPGVISADGAHVHPLEGWCCLVDFIADYDAKGRGTAEKLAVKGGGIPLADVKLEAPIPHPRNGILCVGLNYVEHAIESAKAVGREYEAPERPAYFIKRVDRAVAPGGEIPSHTGLTEMLDYEVELAVIIGKRCRNVKREDAFAHVFGYTVSNDVSARDLQRGYTQWAFGKSLDGSAPMGPWIVTIDEFQSPPSLRVTAKVNGEIRQDSNTNDFIFDIPHLISELSQGITLEPGDIIMTGTPSGVGMGFTPPKFLRPGDVVELEIEGIGVLKNKIKD